MLVRLDQLVIMMINLKYLQGFIMLALCRPLTNHLQSANAPTIPTKNLQCLYTPVRSIVRVWYDDGNIILPHPLRTRCTPRPPCSPPNCCTAKQPAPGCSRVSTTRRTNRARSASSLPSTPTAALRLTHTSLLQPQHPYSLP